MKDLRIIKDYTDIQLPVDWTASTHFNSLERLVNESGQAIISIHENEPMYQIIAKKQRVFTFKERLKRAVSIVNTRSNQSKKDLLLKKYESIHFAVFVSPFNDELIKKTHPFHYLSDEVLTHIFSYLTVQEMENSCRLVNKKWHSCVDIAINERLINVSENVFGKKDWEEHFGTVAEEPLIPKKIQYLLRDGVCPIWPEKKFKDTHFLFLLPQTVDSIPLNLNNLKKIVKFNQNEENNCFSHLFEGIKQNYGNLMPDQPRWILITKESLPKSKGKELEKQKILIRQLVKKSSIDYQIPTVLKLTAGIFAYYAKHQKFLFSNETTHCTQKVRAQHMDEFCPVVVGNFNEQGLYMHYNFNDANVSMAVQAVF